MKNIAAVVLCGGQGSRLKGLVSDRPKPMADISGSPFMDILIRHLRSFGIKKYILCAGFMAGYIEEYYHREMAAGDLVIVKEKLPLGTAGAISHAQDFIETDHFLVVNGDSFCAADLNAFLDFHSAKKARLSMVVSRIDNAADCGSIILDDTNRVVRFEEKKHRGTALANAGIYLFSREVLSLVPKGLKYSLERDLFPRMAGKDFYGFLTDAKLFDIGTPERYAEAKTYFKDKK
ncbi:MAG: sugar phosphate nucleotidyltransferase [Candidatus Omnitrophota bacterium]